MRHKKAVEINGKQIEVKEVTMAEIYNFYPLFCSVADLFKAENIGFVSLILKAGKDMLSTVESFMFTVTTMKKEDLLGMSFSERKELEKAFVEVNGPFLEECGRVGGLLEQLGVNAVIRNMKEGWQKTMSEVANKREQQEKAPKPTLVIDAAPVEKVKAST